MFTGVAVNLPSSLRISQHGSPDLSFTARFNGRSLEPPLYYGVRLVRWSGDLDSAWAAEFVHHKLYLTNGPAEIDRFSISHGFNLLSLMRIFRHRHAHLFVGIGPVLAHPENQVRGIALSDNTGIAGTGYHITGPVVTTGIGLSFKAAEKLALLIEGRSTVSRVNVPVAAGEAKLYNIAFHFTVGTGYQP